MVVASEHEPPCTGSATRLFQQCYKRLMTVFLHQSNFIACDANNHTAPGSCMTQPLESGEKQSAKDCSFEIIVQPVHVLVLLHGLLSTNLPGSISRHPHQNQHRGSGKSPERLQLGKQLNKRWSRSKSTQESRTQNRHSLQCARNVGCCCPAWPDSWNGGSLPLQLVCQVLGIQLQEGVVVVERHNQRDVGLQPKSAQSDTADDHSQYIGQCLAQCQTLLCFRPDIPFVGKSSCMSQAGPDMQTRCKPIMVAACQRLSQTCSYRTFY